MAHFLTVVILDLVSVTRHLLRVMFLLLFLVGLPGLSCVYSVGRGRTFLTFLVSFSLFLLLFFLNFFRRLKTLGTRQWFCTSDLSFFSPGIFHSTALAFGNDGVGWSIALGTVLIYFFSTGARPESRIGLSINGLFDHLIEVF